MKTIDECWQRFLNRLPLLQKDLAIQEMIMGAYYLGALTALTLLESGVSTEDMKSEIARYEQARRCHQ